MLTLPYLSNQNGANGVFCEDGFGGSGEGCEVTVYGNLWTIGNGEDGFLLEISDDSLTFEDCAVALVCENGSDNVDIANDSNLSGENGDGIIWETEDCEDAGFGNPAEAEACVVEVTED